MNQIFKLMTLLCSVLLVTFLVISGCGMVIDGTGDEEEGNPNSLRWVDQACAVATPPDSCCNSEDPSWGLQYGCCTKTSPEGLVFRQNNPDECVPYNIGLCTTGAGAADFFNAHKVTCCNNFSSAQKTTYKNECCALPGWADSNAYTCQDAVSPTDICDNTALENYDYVNCCTKTGVTVPAGTARFSKCCQNTTFSSNNEDACRPILNGTGNDCNSTDNINTSWLSQCCTGTPSDPVYTACCRSSEAWGNAHWETCSEKGTAAQICSNKGAYPTAVWVTRCCELNFIKGQCCEQGQDTNWYPKTGYDGTQCGGAAVDPTATPSATATVAPANDCKHDSYGFCCVNIDWVPMDLTRFCNNNCKNAFENWNGDPNICGGGGGTPTPEPTATPTGGAGGDHAAGSGCEGYGVTGVCSANTACPITNNCGGNPIGKNGNLGRFQCNQGLGCCRLTWGGQACTY